MSITQKVILAVNTVAAVLMLHLYMYKCDKPGVDSTDTENTQAVCSGRIVSKK